jgi:hypothetical protein
VQNRYNLGLQQAKLRKTSRKDDGAPAGTVFPADANRGVLPFLIGTLSRQFFGLFPLRLPAKQPPKLPLRVFLAPE